jgi:transposase/uncharacterized coiled-coil protein SlyX
MAHDEYQELLELRETVKEQKQIISKLESQVENLTQAILHMQKKQFGSSSEKTPQTEEQLSFFNEAEVESNSNAVEPTPQTIASYQRTPRQPGVREEMIKDLPKEVVECVLKGDDASCPECGSSTAVIGKNIVRMEVEFVPASVKVIEYVQHVYKCTECGKSNDRANDVIIKASVPAPVMKRSLASPSSVAQVMYQKYMNGMPLYRQEHDWLQHGIALSRSTMANWVIRCANDWLRPLYDMLKSELVKTEIINADETRIQCNREQGKKASSESFMWLYRTGTCEDHAVVLFEYTRTRAGKHAKLFLEGFTGYLITDYTDKINIPIFKEERIKKSTPIWLVA